MLRTRHRVAALFGCVVAVGVATQAFGQATVVLQYNTPTYFSTLAIGGSYSNGQQSGANVDVTNGAIIVPTASFGYIPTGSEGTELGTAGVVEKGTNAIVDAVLEGEYLSGGYQNGPNGIMSSTAATDTGSLAGNTTVGYVDNSLTAWNTWRGVNLNALPNGVQGSQVSLIGYTYVGDLYMEGQVGSDDVQGILTSIRQPGSSGDGTGVQKWVDGCVLGDIGQVTSADLQATLAIVRANLPNLGFNPNAPAQATSVAASAVPEPGTFGLFGIFVLFVLSAFLWRSRRLISSFNQRISAMMRVKLLRNAASLGLVALCVVLMSGVANANIYLDLVNAADGSQNVKISSSNDDPTLDVYAVITDPTPDNGTAATSDAFLFANASFATTGAALKGDVSFGSFVSALYPNGGGSQAGTNFTAANSTEGLGGTSSTDTTSAHWWSATAQAQNGMQGGTYINASGGTLSSSTGAVGVEYLLGTLNVNFAPYASDWSTLTTTTTSTISILAKKGTTVSKPFSWVATNNNVAQQGTSTLVGNGGDGSLVFLPLTFTFSSSGVVTTNPGVLGASLGLSGPTVGLGGTTLPLAGTVSNTATNSYAVNWNQSGLPAGSTLTPASGSVANGSPVSLSGAVGLPAANFGPWQSVVTFTGTDTNGNVSTPVPQTLNYSIIGKGTTAGADGTGVPGGSYGILLSTAPNTTNLAGLVSTLGVSSTSYGIGQTTATILAGNTTATTVTEQWRSRASSEIATVLSVPLFSDVVDLSGIGSGAVGTYELQMTYDPNAVNAATGGEAYAASNGFLYLGARSAQTGKWVNAVTLDSTTGTAAQTNGGIGVQGPFSSISASNTLANLLGSWGVDTANHTVWAVIDYSGGEFAAVPEPGTLALLGAGALALAYAYRRRKVAKA
ncbi:MAG: beta strand repeat-containing protein [Thermoguttaceae bacterium]